MRKKRELMDINFEYKDEFLKDCNHFLKKKCTTLCNDLETLKKALRVKIPEHPSTKRITYLGESVKIPIYKVRRFRCKQIKKGSYSGFRIIYAYIDDSSTVSFIQIYKKSKNESEDKKRIYKYFKEPII